MNHDPPVIATADLLSPAGEGSSAAAGAAEANRNDKKKLMRERVLAQVKKKADYINDIMLNLDVLIYAELCVVYYME